MSTPFFTKLVELSSQGEPFAVATVISIEGATSAKPGAKAIIDATGNTVLGWVGGGCAESAVREEALASLQDGRTRVIALDLSDEILGVGMPCGGIMNVYVEPFLPRPQLVIVGHGGIAESLAVLAQLMHFAVTVNDPAATREAFPSVDQLITTDLDFSQIPIGPQTYVVVATQHKGDHLAIQKALADSTPYVALIASRTRSQLVFDSLREAGVTEEELARIRAPVGLDLGAVSPEEIGLSIMAEIVALRRGGSGLPLSQIKGVTSAPQPAKDTDGTAKKTAA